MIQELTNLLSYRVWAFDNGFAARAVPIILAQMKSGNLSLAKMRADTEKKISERYSGLDATRIGTHVGSVRAVKTKSGQYVAIIPIFGALTKRGEMCSYGMRDYSNELHALNENPDIAAIVLDIESPGGTVDGTNEFGMSIRASKKPVVAFGDNMVASAAYWIGSQTRHIVGNKNNPTEFGSIGVYQIYENWSKYIEENIGTVEIIRAPQSTEKILVNPIEPLQDDQRAEMVADLKAIAADFEKAVKKGRGDRLDTKADGVFTGKMFKAADALKIGLIDSLGTLADAVNIAAQLSNSSSKSNANKKSMNVNQVARRVSSFFKPKKAAVKAAEGEPAAAEDNTPMWTADMVFNTDGSGDGAFCLHPDAEGNDRKFETKIDNNEGNEPPTDPAVTEDDNWSVVAEEVEETGTEEEGASNEPAADATVVKLNGALKKANATVKAQAAEIATLKKTVADQKTKLDKKPVGASTTVVSAKDKGPEYGAKKAVHSWEKKAAKKVGAKIEE